MYISEIWWSRWGKREVWRRSSVSEIISVFSHRFCKTQMFSSYMSSPQRKCRKLSGSSASFGRSLSEFCKSVRIQLRLTRDAMNPKYCLPAFSYLLLVQEEAALEKKGSQWTALFLNLVSSMCKLHQNLRRRRLSDIEFLSQKYSFFSSKYQDIEVVSKSEPTCVMTCQYFCFSALRENMEERSLNLPG